MKRTTTKFIITTMYMTQIIVQDKFSNRYHLRKN
uniref:Uncharacterized protein n=1 Tax=Arundo donax TaxID=35708 RepID=A0A0A9F8M3_ARUDO